MFTGSRLWLHIVTTRTHESADCSWHAVYVPTCGLSVWSPIHSNGIILEMVPWTMDDRSWHQRGWRVAVGVDVVVLDPNEVFDTSE